MRFNARFYSTHKNVPIVPFLSLSHAANYYFYGLRNLFVCSDGTRSGVRREKTIPVRNRCRIICFFIELPRTKLVHTAASAGSRVVQMIQECGESRSRIIMMFVRYCLSIIANKQRGNSVCPINVFSSCHGRVSILYLRGLRTVKSFRHLARYSTSCDWREGTRICKRVARRCTAVMGHTGYMDNIINRYRARTPMPCEWQVYRWRWYDHRKSEKRKLSLE